MLGLRCDSDVAVIRSLQSAATGGGHYNARSHKFAAKLAGRFYEANTFQKRTKELMGPDPAQLAQRKPKLAQAVFIQRQNQEIQQDSERLQELEAQLLEIQKRKELRRLRDQNRNKKKIEYLAACKIQHAIRFFLLSRARQAADVLISFLRWSRKTRELL